jgi:energy-coupling factor transport system substrate-specific component
MRRFGVKEAAAAAIGTALFVILTEVQIPLVIVSNTGLQVRAALLAFLAAAFGPVVGGIVGLLGHALGDLLFSGAIWWSWAIPDALFGILVGLFVKKYHIQDGSFGGRQIFFFNAVQIAANVIAWIFTAPILDKVIYEEPLGETFAQGGAACAANIIIVAILGTLLGIAGSRIEANKQEMS